MSITLNATVASVDANSYLSLADANAMAVNFGLLNWARLMDDQKCVALIRAAIDVDSHRIHDNAPWRVGQTFVFPRETDVLTFGTAPIIPKPVLWAVMYQADYLGMNGEADRKNWEGAKGDALKDSGRGSPLCPRAWAAFSKYVSRCGNFVNEYPNSDAYMKLYAILGVQSQQ